jgi:transcriptional regulator with XRE-family HTH domain
MLSSRKVSRLKERREEMGMSQSQLARKADIPVRTIQQYEQKQKNINHARITYLTVLARVLRCNEADIMEYDFSGIEP